MNDANTEILNQHEVRIKKVEDEMVVYGTSLAVFTSIMESIGKDLKSLKVVLEKHMENEEQRIVKALVYSALILGAGLIGTIVYIFTHQPIS